MIHRKALPNGNEQVRLAGASSPLVPSQQSESQLAYAVV